MAIEYRKEQLLWETFGMLEARCSVSDLRSHEIRLFYSGQ
jgi:hypothetical protein